MTMTDEAVKALLDQYERYTTGKDGMTLSAETTGDLARALLEARAECEGAHMIIATERAEVIKLRAENARLAADLAAAQAQDAFPLSSHGHWNLHYVDDPAGAYCSASVTGDGLYLSVDVNPRLGLVVYVIDDSKDWIEQAGLTIFAQVDDRKSWQINGVTSYDRVMEFNLQDEAGMKFLDELSNGRAVQFDYNEEGSPPGYGDVTFSLLGSGAAITALAECARRL